MEYCKGGDLDDLLKKGRIPEDQVIKIMNDVFNGLKHLNSLGVIHRDIKPTNIMFDGENYKIGDYGLSKVMGDDLFKTMTKKIGSPLY